jgi:CRISPR/Cas system-associated exonuclease Cas4 (RecB family)
VFFTSYLQKLIDKPIVAPEITTIGELFSGYSACFQPEKLQLISLLYSEFKKQTQTTETFDQFYFWGEMLLSDFNDIDRYLVDAKDLFTNVANLKEIDTYFDYLTEEQKEALKQFWGSVAVADRKEFQQKHAQIWEKLYPVYDGFKNSLKGKNQAYPGMADRLVVEALSENNLIFPFEKYYFVGLNALNECEKRLFRYLKNEEKALFLWDYDGFYTDDPVNEAGKFMRENLLNFPPPADFGLEINSFSGSKNIELVAVSSSNGQAQQIPVFLDKIQKEPGSGFDETAVVLADESLLFPVLGAIPEKYKTINVTMGYPVRNSMVHGFLLLLIRLLKNKKVAANGEVTVYHRFVTDILRHQLLSAVEAKTVNSYLTEIQSYNKITVKLSEINFSDIHKTIFSVPLKVQDYSRYFLQVLSSVHSVFSNNENESILIEIINSVYNAVEKLDLLVAGVEKEQETEISESVYFRLLSQYLAGETVTFEGEPLSGIQVMGILETRCLDFKNLVIIGLNESKWPRTFTTASFIPHNIRKAFALPSIEEQDAMYAYYFYRLIQRTENISATYNVVKDGIQTGELSRYGYQLLFDSPHKPVKKNLDFSFAAGKMQPIVVAGSETLSKKLLDKNSVEFPLSPSAINTYLQCNLRFYFKYLAGLPEPDELKEEIDGAIFGTIFHEVLEELYTPFVGKTVNTSDFDKILNDRIRLDNLILRKIRKVYLKQPEDAGTFIPEGKTILFFENLKIYIERLLKIDRETAPFQIVSLEMSYKTSLAIEIGGATKHLFVGGKIDRIDKINGVTRIIDYKTGNVGSLAFKEVEELFRKDEKNPKKEILQALIYSIVVQDCTSETEIKPAIFSLRKLFSDNFDPHIKMDKTELTISVIKEEFTGKLKMLLAEIYSSTGNYEQTPHAEHCMYCAYNTICQRY